MQVLESKTCAHQMTVAEIVINTLFDGLILDYVQLPPCQGRNVSEQLNVKNTSIICIQHKVLDLNIPEQKITQ